LVNSMIFCSDNAFVASLLSKKTGIMQEARCVQDCQNTVIPAQGGNPDEGL